jgi:NTP pyrophosphatase (non-canonical NTP hydrolase)
MAERLQVKSVIGRLYVTPTSDHATTLAELREAVHRFVAERDWQQFHSPKNLSMAMAIEAAELMEHFQWLTIEASRQLKEDGPRREAVGEELADVFCYLLALSNELELDITSALHRKMQKNAQKYPVSQYRGRYGPDDPTPNHGDG